MEEVLHDEKCTLKKCSQGCKIAQKVQKVVNIVVTQLDNLIHEVGKVLSGHFDQDQSQLVLLTYHED
jgi:hypothetical protein